VQRLLGHRAPKVTTPYAHLSSDAMLEAVVVLGRVVTMERLKIKAKAEEKGVRRGRSVSYGAISDISGRANKTYA